MSGSGNDATERGGVEELRGRVGVPSDSDRGTAAREWQEFCGFWATCIAAGRDESGIGMTTSIQSDGRSSESRLACEPASVRR